MPDLTPTPTTVINEAQRMDIEAVQDRLRQIEAIEADLGAEKAGLLFRLKKFQGPTKRGPRKPATTSTSVATGPAAEVTADMTSKADVLAGKPAPVLRESQSNTADLAAPTFGDVHSAGQRHKAK